MPYDPAVTAIAVATKAALPEHVWRHDITATGSTNPVAHLAEDLHHSALQFTATAQLLHRLLEHLADIYGTGSAAVSDVADLDPRTVETAQLHLEQHIGRFDAQRASLLTLYRLWRRHRPLSRTPRRQHLWLQPHDPRHGMITLDADESALAWWVTPDDTAAAAFGTPDPGVVAGDVWPGSAGWHATAYRDHEHRHTTVDQVFHLPAAATQLGACRALLRWWALHATTNVRPDDLTAAVQSALTA
ncbi:hypothetical protein [Actinoplanes sp. DH11]|uniref:hypothetical protein n=1 Tax=Actinoplanes sp. DH11 TaxID=2857011 RepID=UPI001E57411C|nr:hypothetical protein [Actinoplanes sp. DH11]